MALYVRQNEDRSKLQERLAAELQEKAKTQQVETTQPDGVDDSRYMEGTKTTTSLAWVWLVVAMFAIGAVVFLIVSSF